MITICGDPTSRYGGPYTKTSDNTWFSTQTFDYGGTQLTLDPVNKFWILHEPVSYGWGSGMAQYYTPNGSELFGARWKMTRDGYNNEGSFNNKCRQGENWQCQAYLPGNLKSNENDWVEAPVSFVLIDHQMECPYYKNVDDGLYDPVIPNEIYVCGQNCVNCPDVFGRYELQKATQESNNFPYYKFVGELTQPDNNLVIWFNVDWNGWIITKGLSR